MKARYTDMEQLRLLVPGVHHRTQTQTAGTSVAFPPPNAAGTTRAWLELKLRPGTAQAIMLRANIFLASMVQKISD